ncbi:MAG: DNA polymerase III subunit chi [Pseudomonadota bacterium]
MTQIDFYVVEDSAHDAWLRYACRLIEKAYTMGMHIHVNTADESMTLQMDDLLWTFRDRSFIPHQQTCEQNELCAVTLNHEAPKDSEKDTREVLVNLSSEVPENYQKYTRIVEIFASNDVMKQSARNRYKFYKNNGEEPTHHQV